jgi:hypothetical protein
MVGLTEDVAGSALNLFNAVRQPVQMDVKAVIKDDKKKDQGHTIGTVWEGRPILIMDNGQSGDKFKPTEVNLVWGTPDNKTVKITTIQESPTGLMALLWAGRQIEDLESAMDLARDGPVRAVVEKDLKQISGDYGLASRMMSLAAVIKRIGDRTGEQPEQQIVPVGMPDGMQTAGVFGVRSASVCDCASPGVCCMSSGGGTFGGVVRSLVSQSPTSHRSHPRGIKSSSRFVGERHMPESSTNDPVKGGFADTVTNAFPGYNIGEVRSVNLDSSFLENSSVVSSAFPAGTEILIVLASLEDDGGLPGPDIETRWIRTASLALAILQEAVVKQTSMYSLHLSRMTDFLENHCGQWPANNAHILIPVLRAGSSTIEGDWLKKFNELGPIPDQDARYALWEEISVGITR